MTLRASFNETIFSYLDLLLPDYSEQKKIGDFFISDKSKNRPKQTNQRTLGRDGENPVRLLVRAV